MRINSVLVFTENMFYFTILCYNQTVNTVKEGMTVIDFLKKEKINSSLIEGLEEFRASHPVRQEDRARIPVPRYLYYGREVWEQAIAALLCGQNLLLAGPKATGKNILSQNLAAAFGRPVWDVSLHVNMDADSLIGTDTFENGKVVFRPGPIYRCGVSGGFGVLDEINMARNEALAVLHGVLDFRRKLDVPGYDVVQMDEGTRFIATMNYGYAGTRELNEALTSRFSCLQMPPITEESLERLIEQEYPGLKRNYAKQFIQLFMDIERKCGSAQLSTRPLDLRGLLDAVGLMKRGLDPGAALDMGLTNKSFDPYEQTLVRDLIRSRIPKKIERDKLFTD